jgi:glutamine amidotransferase
MITIVDYGLGNVLAFANVFKRLNIGVSIARRPHELQQASKIILPGVGAFDHAMERLEQSDMRPTLDALALNDGIPVLGVCVGMQMLGRASEEGSLDGLGWIPGRVRGFKSISRFDLPLPHMGWNDVRAASESRLFRHLESGTRFYFLHSYFFECEERDNVAAVSTYGVEFSCAVNYKNIFGVQFHPEKSHHSGTQLLRNFADM